MSDFVGIPVPPGPVARVTVNWHLPAEMFDAVCAEHGAEPWLVESSDIGTFRTADITVDGQVVHVLEASGLPTTVTVHVGVA